ncbi:hypothetical protein GCM10023075_24720 [Streptosporangium album]|uniref:hypothetical protein n=1 Tax=Streptosporangium album TaxID=47479 RepID=UPI0031E59EE2
MTPPLIEIRSASAEDAALLAGLNDSVHSVHALHRPDVFRARPAHREAGCSRLITDVWDFNKEAQAFYEAAGFAPVRHWLEQPLR